MHAEGGGSGALVAESRLVRPQVVSRQASVSLTCTCSLEPSTGVTTAELRAWLKLCILTGVVQMNWRKKHRHQRKYYRCLHMNDPEPPHRFELIRRLRARTCRRRLSSRAKLQKV